MDSNYVLHAGDQSGDNLPAIEITPGNKGVKVENIIFDATGGL